MRRLISLLPLALLLALLPDPAHAGPVVAALGKVVVAVKAAAEASTIVAFLVRTAVSLGLSALQRALQGKPRQPGITTEVTQTGGTNPQSFILGRYATAGQFVAPPMS